MRSATAPLAVVAGLLLTGCTQYYQVKDPSTGIVYHTTAMKDLDTGAIRFTDAVTGASVTVQNSEVTELSGSEYKAAVAAQEAAPE